VNHVSSTPTSSITDEQTEEGATSHHPNTTTHKCASVNGIGELNCAGRTDESDMPGPSGSVTDVKGSDEPGPSCSVVRRSGGGGVVTSEDWNEGDSGEEDSEENGSSDRWNSDDADDGRYGIDE